MINKLKYFFKTKEIKNAKFIYIYSDFRKLFEENKKNPEKSVELLLNFFIKKGITCVVPSFSYTTSGNFFVNKTRSKVGFLANFIMKKFKYERSEHPLFSFVAIGKNKKIVKKIGKSAFGIDSVHSRLFKKNSYFLNFCRPLAFGNTLVHHIEQIQSANYRFDKKFKTKVFKKKKYLGSNFSAYLRKNPKNLKTLFSFKKAMKILKNRKYISTYKSGNLTIQLYKYDLIYLDLLKLISRDKKVFIKN